MTMKVDETGMLHKLTRSKLAQKSALHNFFSFFSQPIPVGFDIGANCVSGSRIFPFST